MAPEDGAISSGATIKQFTSSTRSVTTPDYVNQLGLETDTKELFTAIAVTPGGWTSITGQASNQTTISGPAVGVTGLSGGGANLDAVETVSMTVGTLYILQDSTYGWGTWELISGTQATSLPGFMRPLDYNGTTNQKVWIRRE